MKISLLGFKNPFGETLRGILCEPAQRKTDTAVVLAGGFERAATTEAKHRRLAERLAGLGVSSLRFDATGCGLSDGDFSRLTVSTLAGDLEAACTTMLGAGYRALSVFAHSLAGCAVSAAIDRISFEKIALMAPALDQRGLHRFWYVQQSNPDREIGWNDWPQLIDESAFLAAAKLEMTAKSHRVAATYRETSKDQDYAATIGSFPAARRLLIHGAADDKVPVQSVRAKFANQILVPKGDHDLERPGVIEQWVGQTAEFLAT